MLFLVTNGDLSSCVCRILFAIRSGNWLLRNSCLKVLSVLFFAYSRDKYEVLSVNALADSYTYPKQVLENFKNGE